MHSFGLTERWLVLAEFPYVVNPLQPRAQRPPVHRELPLEARARHPLHPRRRATAAKTISALRHRPVLRLPPHQRLRARRRGRRRPVRVRGRPDRPGPLPRQPALAARPSRRRCRRAFVLSLGDRAVTRERIADGGLELPRINYRRCNGRPYRYAWGNDTGPSGWLEKIVRVDADTGTASAWSQPGLLPGRAGVRRRARRHGRRTTACCCRSCSTPRPRRSFLLVLDASTLAPLARAVVPHAIPFGFHGQFARA